MAHAPSPEPPRPGREQAAVGLIIGGLLVSFGSVYALLKFDGPVLGFVGFAVGLVGAVSGVVATRELFPLDGLRLEAVGPVRAGEQCQLVLQLTPRRRLKFVVGTLVVESAEKVFWEDPDGPSGKLFERILGVTTIPLALPAELSDHLRMSVSVLIPEAAMPTFKRSPREFVTRVKVRLRFVDQYDASTESEIAVAAERAGPFPAGLQNSSQSDLLELHLDDGLACPGGAIKGRVVVKASDQAARAGGLLLSVKGSLLGTGRDDNIGYLTRYPGPFSGAAEYKFALEIPRDAPLSFKGKHFEVLWRVSAALDVSLASNPVLELPFRVVHRPVEPTG